MADLLLHLIVPGITLLAFYDRKYLPWIILLTPLTQLQAIDHLDALYEYNRALLHNLFITIPFALIAAAGYLRKNGTIANIGMISAFYAVSHTILDLDGVALFWPLSNQAYKLIFNIPLGRPGQLAVMSASVHVLIVFVLAFLISLPNVKREISILFEKKPPQ